MSEILVRDDGPERSVRRIALNRPATRNGLTPELNQQLIEALDAAGADRAVRCVLLTGEGGSFCSGLDLKDAMARGATLDGAAERLDRYFHGLIRAVRRLDKPIVALVDGAAVGFGCDLALACDIRLGTPRTRFGEIFIKRGLMPDGGGSFFLPRLIGWAHATELLLTGEIVEAAESLRLGLVSRLLPEGDVEASALAYAGRLAQGAPRVHAWVKRDLRASENGSLDDVLALERTGQLELLQSKDFFEGISAFLQKRDPRFTGE